MNIIAYPTYPTNRTNPIPTPHTSSKRPKKNIEHPMVAMNFWWSIKIMKCDVTYNGLRCRRSEIFMDSYHQLSPAPDGHNGPGVLGTQPGS